MATLTYRDGSATPYKAVIRRADYPTESQQFRTARERTKWVRYVEGQMDAGTWVSPKQVAQEKIAAGTVGELIARYCTHLGWPFTTEERTTAPTKDRYNRCTALRKVAREIGHVYPADLTIDYVYAYAEEKALGDGKRKPLSPRTMSGIWKTLEKACNWWRISLKVDLAENPFTATLDQLTEDGIVGVANERTRRIETLYDYTYQGTNPKYVGKTFQQISEYDLLMLELEWQDHYLVDIIDFALASTMRCSHIMKVRRGDIDWDNNVVRRERKISKRGKKQHEIEEEGVLPNAALAILKRVIDRQDNLPSLADANRQELYDAVWERPIHIVCHDLGMSDQGLRKKCKRLNIPVPPRGYWQKKQNGVKGARRTPLPKMAASEQRSISDLVFPFPTTPQAVSRAFNGICKDLGLEGLTFHCLRHEGISRLVEDPKRHEIELIMAVSGHHSKASLDRYTHLRPGHHRRKWGKAIDAL